MEGRQPLSPPGGGAPQNRVVLMPDALRDLERLPIERQLSVLDAFERDFDPTIDRAESFTVDGILYYSAPISEGLNALFRPLTRDEIRDHVMRRVIDDVPGPAIMVFGLERPAPEPTS